MINTPKRVIEKCLLWRNCAGLHAIGICSSKIHCQTYRFQPFTTLGRGVKKAVSVFFVTFGQKKLVPSSDDIRRYSTILGRYSTIFRRCSTKFKRYSRIFKDIQTIFDDIQTMFDDIQTIFRRYSTVFHDLQTLFERYWV